MTSWLTLDHKKTSFDQNNIIRAYKMTNSTPKALGINRNIWSFSRWTVTVSVVFGPLSFASITLSSFETLCALYSLTAPWSYWIILHTYISFADIVWVLVYISCKSKIANLHNVVFRQQDVTCGQITVNTLGEVKERSYYIMLWHTSVYCNSRI